MAVDLSYSEKDSGDSSNLVDDYVDATDWIYQFQNSAGYQLAEGYGNEVYGFLEQYDSGDSYYLGTLYVGKYRFYLNTSDWVAQLSDVTKAHDDSWDTRFELWRTGYPDLSPHPLVNSHSSYISGTGSGVNADKFIVDPIGDWSLQSAYYTVGYREWFEIEIEAPIELTIRVGGSGRDDPSTAYGYELHYTKAEDYHTNNQYYDPALMLQQNPAVIQGSGVVGSEVRIEGYINDREGFSADYSDLQVRWYADGVEFEGIDKSTSVTDNSNIYGPRILIESAFTLRAFDEGKEITAKLTYVDGWGYPEEIWISTGFYVNTRPVANDTVLEVKAGTNLDTQLEPAFDADGDLLTYTKISDPANGSLTFSEDGLFSYVPNVGFSGEDTFTYLVSDGKENSNSAVAYINVVQNKVPTFSSIPLLSATEDVTYRYQVIASDGDADDEVVLSAITAEWLTFDAVAGVLSGTPTNDVVGEHQVTLRAADSTNAYAYQRFVISVANVNDAPVSTLAVSGEAKEGQELSISGSISDPDGLGAVSYQWFRDDEIIPYATSLAYQLTHEDVGAAIHASATYTDGFGYLETVRTSSTGKISSRYDITFEGSFDLSLHTDSYNLYIAGSGDYYGYGNHYDNKIIGNSGHNTLRGFGGSDSLDGGDGDDTVEGGGGDDIVLGGGGDDLLSGGVGKNFLAGGLGNDTVTLTADGVWSNRYSAVHVSDDVSVGTGQRIALGGKNRFDDVVWGQGGQDSILLTDGDDVLALDDRYSGYNERALVNSDGTDLMRNTARVDGFEEIFAGAGNDVIDLTSVTFGSSAGVAARLYGEAGDDVLWSGRGNDFLLGGEGNDRLNGGAGNDELTGGLGADIFEFTSTSGADVITDFDVDNDLIHIYTKPGDTQEVTFSNDTITWGTVSIQLQGLSASSLTLGDEILLISI